MLCMLKHVEGVESYFLTELQYLSDPQFLCVRSCFRPLVYLSHGVLGAAILRKATSVFNNIIYYPLAAISKSNKHTGAQILQQSA